MTNSKRNNATDKIIGKTKESVGKITDNEQLELEGKIQSAKSDLKEKMKDIDDKFNEIKEDVAGKINDTIDKNKSKSKDE